MLHFQHFSEINTIKTLRPVRLFIRSFELVRLLCYRKPTTTMQSKYFVSTLCAGVLGIELAVRCSVKLAFRLTEERKKAAIGTAEAVDRTSNKQTNKKRRRKNE